MLEELTKERLCNLRMHLSGFAGVHTCYDSRLGLRRCVALRGHVDDPRIGGRPDYSDPRFHGRRVEVTVYSPPDAEWLERVRTARGLRHACGVVTVNAGVEPERFECQGRLVEDEPLYVRLDVTAEAFDAIQHQAADSCNHRRGMFAMVTLIGEPLPEPTSATGLVRLKELDVSVLQYYAIGSFELFDAIYNDSLRGHVRPVAPTEEDGRGTSIVVLLSEITYGLDAASGRTGAITCGGRTLNHPDRTLPYDDAEATVSFHERYETVASSRLPEDDSFNRFRYRPRRSDNACQFTKPSHFSFFIDYGPEDARALLFPLLTWHADSRVALKLRLANEPEELMAATDELQGRVQACHLEVRRQLREPEKHTPDAIEPPAHASTPDTLGDELRDRGFEAKLTQLIEDEQISPRTRDEIRRYLDDYLSGRLDNSDKQYVLALHEVRSEQPESAPKGARGCRDA